MHKAFVLMTAMPPTVGHINLVRFAGWLAPDVHIIVNTQPGEPYVYERVAALSKAVKSIGHQGMRVYHIHKTLPQAPEECETEFDFWDMWHGLLTDRGFHKGDTIVASEEYGIPLSKHMQARFMPYDPDRELRFTKATDVRIDPEAYFDYVLPEFQPVLRPTITLFGAESTGKTTLSRGLAEAMEGQWLWEYARPYLEMVGPTIDTQAMVNIWNGQLAAQKHIGEISTNKRYIIQDTDLFSTVGYWGFWQPQSLPKQLELDAISNKSDLYIIMNSDIPFEEDPIRYGGGGRESDDQYWIDLCERYELNYHYIEATSPLDQLDEAKDLALIEFNRRGNPLFYNRSSNG